ncbi:MAG: GGDEF domain-containing protein [Gammaproteobacteria bacterium]|nr:GGDEF domain-containing protein [Gammaproteobacteria bacterium]
MGLTDISWTLIELAIVLGLLIYIYSRNFVLKRYSRDLQWAKDESRLQFLASCDALTKLPNRRFLVNLLEFRLEEQGGKVEIAMLFLDIDLFKQVNDSHGHRVGDLLLQEVAARIKKTLRKDDLVGRLGGDEFVVMLPGGRTAAVGPRQPVSGVW